MSDEPNIVRVLVPAEPAIIRVLTQGPPGPQGVPGNLASAWRGPFPNGHIAISEDGLLNLDPSYGATDNIAEGNGAMAQSVSPTGTVAIGGNAGWMYGQEYDAAEDVLGTGANWSASYVHTPGSTAPLIFVLPLMAGNVPYFLDFSVVGATAGSVSAQTDGGGLANTIGGAVSNGDYDILTRTSVGNTQLSFLPTSDFDGQVVGVKLISLAGRESVFVGDLCGQFARNGSSLCAYGGYAMQGQEYDPDTGEDIHGTHPLDGTNDNATGEANSLHMRGGATGNCSYGFNGLFNNTEGSSHAGFGNSTGLTLTTQTGDAMLGTSAYQRGFASNGTFVGTQCGLGAFISVPITAPVAQGDKIIHVTDASLFAIGGLANNGTIFGPGTTVTDRDLINNTITVNHACFNDTAAGTLIESIASPHVGAEVAAGGYLCLQNIAGAMTQVAAWGPRAGRNATSSKLCLFGYRAGDTITDQPGHVMLGWAVQPSSVSAHDELNLANAVYATGLNQAPTKPLVGIGIQAPAQRLDVGGDIGVNSTKVIASDRIFWKRILTVATVPTSKTAGQSFDVSDAPGGYAPAYTDGTNVRNSITGSVIA